MQVFDVILKEIEDVIGQVDEADLDVAMALIQKDTRIFVDGSGRSGFQAKGFAMRLMHIGYSSHVIGETVTPSIAAGDVYFAVSGSGKTKNVVNDTRAAKEQGLTVIAATSKIDSPLAELADCTLVIPGATKGDKNKKSVQLLSSLFDQAVHITLDALCLKLSRRDHTSEADAAKMHTNVE
ncbi:6-phospho-3-hexuloisomerase [Sporolactobacillus terrae]|uniref:6-phospho-3-hexuloisomerase n=1 Tax=Sporolactobacillus terrae TaxID=269673 RepID=UPI00111A0EF4|nr:6-phospho-3-hexuloisomerase [Sporolactobacillus terrae]